MKISGTLKQMVAAQFMKKALLPHFAIHMYGL